MLVHGPDNELLLAAILKISHQNGGALTINSTIGTVIFLH